MKGHFIRFTWSKSCKIKKLKHTILCVCIFHSKSLSPGQEEVHILICMLFLTTAIQVLVTSVIKIFKLKFFHLLQNSGALSRIWNPLIFFYMPSGKRLKPPVVKKWVDPKLSVRSNLHPSLCTGFWKEQMTVQVSRSKIGQVPAQVFPSFILCDDNRKL